MKRRRIRCAIYTRKSHEAGLEQDFNSLDAQHEACSAYITSQKAEGWELVSSRYDDGGISGGTLERPALLRVLRDIEDGRVDQIVVYKIDRLTRSLPDFAKIVDRLDATDASFVSVTQSFNTATSMGRLTLNMLLSFAQFEREQTAERIRDKIAASKKKGLWMGGTVPFGYTPQGRSLAIVEPEAVIVRSLYQMYLELGSVRQVTEHAAERGYVTRTRTYQTRHPSGGTPFARSNIHRILSNPLYAGRIQHKNKVYDGMHAAIVEASLWSDVQDHLTGEAARDRAVGNRAASSPLVGKLFDECGDGLTPSHTQKNGTRLRYYVSRRLIVECRAKHPDAWRLPAKEVEHGITMLLQDTFNAPSSVAKLIRDIQATEVTGLQDRLHNLAILCDPTKDALRWAQLVKRVDLSQGSLQIELAPDHIATHLDVPLDRINRSACSIIAQFRTKRRGVETKIIIGGGEPHPDAILAKNILLAREWYTKVKSGKTFVEIAKEHGTTRSRVQNMINLAFLAPDVLDSVAAGTQPLGLTSQWAKQNSIPSDWSEQRGKFKAL